MKQIGSMASEASPATDIASRQTELAAIIEGYCGEDGSHPTPIPGLTFFRQSSPTAAACAVVKSLFALLVRGTKRVVLADETYDYDARHYLITSVDLPLLAQVTAASPQAPYLGLAFDLDAHQIGELMSRMPPAPASSASVARGLALVLDTPAAIPVLAPLIEQELLYHLLSGEQGVRLRDVAIKGSHGHRISRAIQWINQRFAQPMAIDELAGAVSMSKSSLHHHFKALTSMSPLQYQKTLRLQEARRLMLVEQLDAASASHRVGYESPSQFSREYRRVFGAPPFKDVAQMRQVA
jgi:AraC-like DNA-binding protein